MGDFSLRGALSDSRWPETEFHARPRHHPIFFMASSQSPVLILGGGINGCAIARELLLNNMPVWLVDTADVGSGATSGSSRLIHGGLRYLEYGEFDLVKESLGERTRLLRLAPQFVHPLRLWIPSESRFGGLPRAVARFLGFPGRANAAPTPPRGVALVQAGLALYDAYARDPLLPKHQVLKAADVALPVERNRYRWLCSFYDAQVVFPERLVLALLEDARQMAAQRGLDFRVLTYHRAELHGEAVEIHPIGAGLGTDSPRPADPPAIVNATGAWVDESLQRLKVSSRRLMGGTKGSHLFTFSPRLRDALAGQGIYAEASDGRPIFITPLADTVLIGTTDVPFEGEPRDAVATPDEIDYLLSAVNAILPGARLGASDIDFHYSAVRPLPYVHASAPAAITRRHALVQHDNAAVPLFSVVGGKLTTMRSLAETTASAVLAELSKPVTATSEERLIPGGEAYPPDADTLAAAWEGISQRTGFPLDPVSAVWRLCGTLCESILGPSPDRELLADMNIPCAFVRWSIEHEWVTTLGDLVERRLMLLYDQRLTRAALERLAELLVEAGHLPAAQTDVAVDAEIERLAARFGKRVA